eukprot:TRINITY_DN322_c0_g1_i1.p1 TRINITY_DN322_c0_g1~~TRINITY_DN322_c0_g1_i1.p1  ORF type:complete len:133 (-),score=5.19 TRINITY_DN322_c0_g1_i1:205-603(-)
MEVAMEVEDDVFFADLSKQIALLIMDDDEGSPAPCPSVVALQGFSHSHRPIASSTFGLEQSCVRESRGTGVFIPRSSMPRRKNRSGRFMSFNTTANSHRRPLPDKSRGISHVTNNDDQSCNYYNPRVLKRHA